ncbi:hypothetical protein RJ40_08990 [Methanofollis aquaemaris]|uniref:Uncharacterized protein n=1 Tax=Methanofollis aquaemaris TaxID=126734 RepID=A0A8A3S6E7_9EURY|nr:hypothetical protein [Methanofollis aquaemaris]QSZ67632.1 hypothetical protein RJ40_08990 [Methanofollis aquaemaris]
MQTDRDPTAALTRLECGILAAILLMTVAVVIHVGNGAIGAPAGMVLGALDISGHAVIIDDLYGHADPAEPGRMGSVSFSIRLFPGDMGAVDMGQAAVGFATKAEEWSLTRDGPTPPAWKVIERANVPLFHPADDDDLLEPGEVFVLLATPGRSLGSGETFTVTVAPPGGIAASAVRTVPSRVTGVMELA